ncbi:MAG: cytidylate kinase family protein [Sulfurospirillaceae bacterium]|nr:cytidylate kinase family protein [Sulfurospirillaceae bacterium]
MLNLNMTKRIAVFILGQFVMALGVSLSVKAYLGVSPISCVPYVYSLTMPLSLGELTILLNLVFIALQMAVLRKNYQWAQLVQLPSVIIFGYCIDFSMHLLSLLTPMSYVAQVFWCLLACATLAFGIFLLLKTKLTYLPLDGLAVAISHTYHKEFGKVKIILDSSMVTIGIISSFTFLNRLEGIREGSVVAALLVGALIKFYSTKLVFVEQWLGTYVAPQTQSTQETALNSLVITISREYGSGGHEIGEMIAQKLGIPFYDKELIKLTAEETGYTAEYIQANEQHLASELLYELYEQNYAYVDNQLPPADVLFMVQSKIIRNICAKGACVIVGRCANFILKDDPNCFNVFIHANMAYRKTKVNEKYKATPPCSDKDLEMSDKNRANYCLHYTKHDWKDATNYHVTMDASLYGSEKAAQKVIELLKDFAH